MAAPYRPRQAHYKTGPTAPHRAVPIELSFLTFRLSSEPRRDREDRTVGMMGWEGRNNIIFDARIFFCDLFGRPPLGMTTDLLARGHVTGDCGEV